MDSYDTHMCASLSLFLFLSPFRFVPHFFSSSSSLPPIVCGSSLHFVSSFLPFPFFPSFVFNLESRERERERRKSKEDEIPFFSFVRSQFCIFLASKVEEKKSVVTKNNWFVVFFILLVWNEFIF